MKYLPILSELISSDAVVFMLLGLVIAAVIGLMLRKTRKSVVGLIVSFVIYAACEVICVVSWNFYVAIPVLFIGMLAIGGILGFLISAVITKIRN
ncbi:MAG: LPXTG cell wall anchor domain-containing protein [Oscillospiraceae bacterium]|nr:LPXTG cell wall anchor domain-containing protein [Oscillospiraceae bacterium]